ncbi:MAG TPA: methyltransferase domain-containing protein [Pilimelia sp.]|nr:methyltransferase domain-containing protein [Pilimelia sp.]
MAHLRCPLCAAPLAGGPAVRALRCPRGHSFDLARQGYVDLAPGRPRHPGDSAEMVAARADFLAAGHYRPLSTALAEAVCAAVPPPSSAPPPSAPPGAAPPGAAARHLVVDVGCGTGHHLAAVLDATPHAVGVALDISQPALRRAARAHPRAAAVRADTWRRLPLADGAAAVLLNVFAPRNGAEFHRVLRPDGLLLVASPEPDHLGVLVEALGLLRVDPGKADRVAGALGDRFAAAGSVVCRWPMRLSRDAVRVLVSSGPNAWHQEPAEVTRRLTALPEQLTVAAAIRLDRYRPA